MAEREVTLRLRVIADTSQARTQLSGLSGGLRGGRPAGGGGLGGLQIPGGVWGKGGGGFPGAGGAGGGIGDIGMAAEGGAGYLAGAGMAAGAALAVLAAEVAIATRAFHQLQDAVGRANPAVMQRFELVMNDTIATVGRAFVPVMEFATDVVRDIGDVLANVLPSSKDVRDFLNELRPILSDLKGVFMDLAPVIKEGFVGTLRAATITLRLFSDAIHPVVAGLRSILHAIGFVPSENPLSSVGAAARPAQQFSDIVSAIDEMNRAALSGAGQTDQQLSALQSIDANVKALKDFLMGRVQGVNAGLGGGAGQAWASLPVVGAFPPPWEWGR